MADPLSLAASVIAVIGAAEATIKVFDRVATFFKDAQLEFSLLRNEVADLQIVLLNTRAILDQRRTSRQPEDELPPSYAAISRAINVVQSQLKDLAKLLNCYFAVGFDNEGKARLAKRRWAKQRNVVKLMIDNIRRSKSDISMLLQTENLSRSIQLDVAVGDLSQKLNEIKFDILLPQNASVDRLTEQLNAMSLPKAPHLQMTLGKHSGNPAHDSREDRLIEVRAAVSQLTCKAWCSCCCHRRNTLKTPALLNRALGSLFVGYSGIPILTSPCNEKACKARKRFRMFVSFLFPAWGLSRNIAWRLSIESTLGPESLLMMPRKIQFASETYQACVNGDHNKVAQLLHTGLASPYDVDEDGFGLLTLAIQWQHLEVCRLLVSSGVKPYHEDHNGFSPHHYAWDLIFTSPELVKVNLILAEIFPQAEGYKEERRFSRIHKSVLNLIGTSLETELSNSTVDIDSVDEIGRTPLHWAAARGDVTSVKLLLENGANPHIKGHSGSATNSTPLAVAARRQNPELVELLLKAGARPSEPGYRGWTPLMQATGSTVSGPDGVGCIELLLDRGAPIDQLHPTGVTAFGNALNHSNIPTAEALLCRGANINHRDNDGLTPLTGCVFWNAHTSIEYLLQKGADYTMISNEGQTILHLVATYGDLETIRLLKASNINGVDTEALTSSGQTVNKTAMQIAQSRLGVEEAWREEFTSFVEAVKLANDTGDDGTTYWFDAMDHAESGLEGERSDDEEPDTFADAPDRRAA